MTKRVPPSMRTRQNLSDLIEGRLSSPTVARAGQAGDAADRRGGPRGGEPRCPRTGLLRARRRSGTRLPQRCPGSSTEDGRGHDRFLRAANCRPRRALPLGDPRASEGSAPRLLKTWRSSFWRVAYPCGDIEDAFKDETGRLLLSRTAVSEIGERLWADYQEFCKRDLAEHDIIYCSSTGSRSAFALDRSASLSSRPGGSVAMAKRSCCR